jgi:hypothetical protein
MLASISEGSDSEGSDISNDDLHVKRRRMKIDQRKDLHRLKLCMARTGAAAVAATMLANPADGITCMDKASRFRKKHRPSMPDMSTELDNFEELSHQKLYRDYQHKATPMRSYRDCVLDAGGAAEFSEPANLANDWDKLSDMGSEAATDCDSKLDSVSVAGSDIACDWDSKFEIDGPTIDSGHSEDALLDDVLACLDSISRFRRPSRQIKRSERRTSCKSTLARGHAESIRDPGLYEADCKQQGRVVHDETSEQAMPDKDRGSPAAIPFPDTGLVALASNVVGAAQNAATLAKARLATTTSTLVTVLGTPPRHIRGNFTSPSDVLSATHSAVLGTVEERSSARIFLCCAIGLLILSLLTFACLVLVVTAFVASPDGSVVQEQQPVATGMIDGYGRPKSISRVLTVVMISLFAGNGLAIAHPMRDALLCGT